jgi:hypothetical protein
MQLIRNYSAKSFVLFGEDTRDHKELIISLYGSWPRGFLTHPITKEKFKGWVFSNKRLSSVLEKFGKYIEEEKSLPVCLPVVYEDEDEEELPSAPELPREFVVVAKPVKSYTLPSTIYFILTYVSFLYFVYMLSNVIE